MGGTVISVLGGVFPFKVNFIFFVLVAVIGYGIYLPYQERKKYGPSRSKHKRQSAPKAERGHNSREIRTLTKEACSVRRRRVTYRPSKAQGAFGAIWGGIFILIGLIVVIPTFGAFGILWTVGAIIITVMNGYQAFGKKYTGPEITIEDETPPHMEDSSSAPGSESHDHISSMALDAKGRLKQLEELKQAGLISDLEY